MTKVFKTGEALSGVMVTPCLVSDLIPKVTELLTVWPLITTVADSDAPKLAALSKELVRQTNFEVDET